MKEQEKRPLPAVLMTTHPAEEATGAPCFSSAALRAFFCGEALDVLAELILNGEVISYLAGGCQIAACGLHRWITASSEQLRAWDAQGGDNLLSPLSPRLLTVTDRWYHPKHVVVEVEGLILDAGGVQTTDELLACYATRYPGCRLVAYHPAKLTRYRIRADRTMSWELAARLARTFGPFRQEWLVKVDTASSRESRCHRVTERIHPKQFALAEEIKTHKKGTSTP